MDFADGYFRFGENNSVFLAALPVSFAESPAECLVPFDQTMPPGSEILFGSL